MIVREYYTTRKDGVKLYKSYSDNNKIIKKVGTTEEYSAAIDIETASYTYVETDKDIPQEQREIFENAEAVENAN